MTSTVLAILGSWICIGGIITCLCGDGGWTVMIADPHNCRNTWLAFPVLLLCWIFWPFRCRVAHLSFLLIWSFGL